MTIQVELSADTEARLTAAAQANGVSPEKYAGTLLENVLKSSVLGSGQLTPDELHTMLLQMAAGSEHLPVLSPEATTREVMYEDHL